MKILVTGNAGFIGYHLTKKLLARGDTVIGFDVVNDYYDRNLKLQRLKLLEQCSRETGSLFSHIQENLAHREQVEKCFEEHSFDRVIHLAAQAGIRYSLINPHSYVESNLIAFTNILEACRHADVAHLTYASTSSVYGANTAMPFSEHMGADHPIQFYAATKKANELMAHSYSHLFQLPTTALRFFTVYGPWGRPDMALFKFTKNIIEGKPIQVFNFGNHSRDFTYIADIVEGIIRTSDNIAQPDPAWDSDQPDPATSNAPFRVLNIGNNNPTKLIEYIDAIENALGIKAIKEMLPRQPGDVPDTFADVSELMKQVDYKPTTSVQQGIDQFVEWYKSYYHK